MNLAHNPRHQDLPRTNQIAASAGFTSNEGVCVADIETNETETVNTERMAVDLRSLTSTIAAEHIDVTGIVQGVGFRPFVYRLATELGLTGHVGNDSARVFILVVGAQRTIDDFARRLCTEAPPLAHVEQIIRRPTGAVHGDHFTIIASQSVAGERTLVSPDTATCSDCLAELFDPTNRRYRHPFITCTNCGPRFTIIRTLPYDRRNTTMAAFEMCRACSAEYSDPGDRRYHAQPISCHDCGPVLSFRSDDGNLVVSDAAIDEALDAFDDGAIVAVKGIGGYHLSCDAASKPALASLRSRKDRPDKPFAIMVRDLAHAREFAHVTDAEITQLTSPARPIVLLRARRSTCLSDLVAPESPLVGIVLPYSPMHHLLLDGRSDPLVMTSANRSGEPITYRETDAAVVLDALCDAMLEHDRPIHVPCDDSVVRVIGSDLLPIRRARGYAPIPVNLNGTRRTVLAVGGELKNTFCVTDGDHAWVSQHIGDMEDLNTRRAFDAIVDQFRHMYAVEPDVVAADAHPAYASSRWARAHHASRLIEVQHHHAHIAAVMAEHQLSPHEPVIGFAFDGTGYGDDGTIWGGELLVADADGYERLAHLAPVPLPGGDVAIRNPCRMALAHLRAAGVAWDERLAPVGHLDDTELELLRRQLERGVACVPTSSMGRLFDAVASLLGLRQQISFEAQAAIELEIAAESGTVHGIGYRMEIDGSCIGSAGILHAMVGDLVGGVPVPDIALGFHHAISDVVLRLAERTRSQLGFTTVVLSGGVFQNALLTSLCVEALSVSGFDPFTHSVVPPNDGGLSLGQAFIAAHRQNKTDTPSPSSPTGER